MLDGRRRVEYATIVKIDALTSSLADRVPVAILEQSFRLLRNVTKAPVVVVEPVENRARDRRWRRHRTVEGNGGDIRRVHGDCIVAHRNHRWD